MDKLISAISEVEGLADSLDDVRAQVLYLVYEDNATSLVSTLSLVSVRR